jgi:hypothetical protein
MLWIVLRTVYGVDPVFANCEWWRLFPAQAGMEFDLMLNPLSFAQIGVLNEIRICIHRG